MQKYMWLIIIRAFARDANDICTQSNWNHETNQLIVLIKYWMEMSAVFGVHAIFVCYSHRIAKRVAHTCTYTSSILYMFRVSR